MSWQLLVAKSAGEQIVLLPNRDQIGIEASWYSPHGCGEYTMYSPHGGMHARSKHPLISETGTAKQSISSAWSLAAALECNSQHTKQANL